VRLFQLLRDLALRAGLDPERSARTCCAMRLPRICWRAGRTCACCRPLLGHADIATTQICTHVDAARLVALVNARHPLGGVQNGAKEPGP